MVAHATNELDDAKKRALHQYRDGDSSQGVIVGDRRPSIGCKRRTSEQRYPRYLERFFKKERVAPSGSLTAGIEN